MDKHYIFDYIQTRDGHNIGWIYPSNQNEIVDPCNELYYDIDNMRLDAEQIIKDGHTFTNHFFEEEEIEEWEQERDRCKECDGDGFIMSPTYDDPFYEEPCPNCNDESDFEYERSKDK